MIDFISYLCVDCRSFVPLSCCDQGRTEPTICWSKRLRSSPWHALMLHWNDAIWSTVDSRWVIGREIEIRGWGLRKDWSVWRQYLVTECVIRHVLFHMTCVTMQFFEIAHGVQRCQIASVFLCQIPVCILYGSTKNTISKAFYLLPIIGRIPPFWSIKKMLPLFAFHSQPLRHLVSTPRIHLENI